MKARFLHLADCHLGYKQYNRSERFDDFARAFLHIVNVAVEEKVDFVILAGDLFQKRAIDALTLQQAMHILDRLKVANIPCIAVEGNHELSYYHEFLGWVEFLARQEMLVLLSPEFENGLPQIAPYQQRKGAYFDPIPGLRVFGMKYEGASTARVLASYADALGQSETDDIVYSVFVAHTGVEGVLANDSGGLSHRQLAVLRPHVDYLALGHIHKPFIIDDWIYNPGSPETCSMTEASWPDRGYFIVDVDTDREQPDEERIRPLKHQAQLRSNPRRAFHRINVQVDHLASPEALYDHAQELLLRKARDTSQDRRSPEVAPVVELLLTGILPFDRSDLDLKLLEQLVQESFQPLHVQVRNLSRIPNAEIQTDERLSRPELEHRVLSSLFSQDARYAENNEQWAQLAITIKNLALTGSDPESIIQSLAQMPDD